MNEKQLSNEIGDYIENHTPTAEVPRFIKKSKIFKNLNVGERMYPQIFKDTDLEVKEYQKNYREMNKEKNKEYQKNYREMNKDKTKKKYQNNSTKSKRRVYWMRYFEKNKSKIKEKRQKNQLKINERQRELRKLRKNK